MWYLASITKTGSRLGCCVLRILGASRSNLQPSVLGKPPNIWLQISVDSLGPQSEPGISRESMLTVFSWIKYKTLYHGEYLGPKEHKIKLAAMKTIHVWLVGICMVQFSRTKLDSGKWSLLKMVAKEIFCWEKRYLVLIELNKPYFASEVFA